MKYVELTGKEEKHEGKVRITCPFCKDRIPSCIFGTLTMTMQFLCFSCGTAGRVEYSENRGVRIVGLTEEAHFEMSASMRRVLSAGRDSGNLATYLDKIH